MIKTIGICGFGYSGSGAVVDLLKNNPSVNYLDIGEFTLTYIPDGLKDLRYNLFDNCSRFFSPDVALIRFKKRIYLYCKEKAYSKNQTKKIMTECDKFIESVTQVKWKGFWKIDRHKCHTKLNYFFYRLNYKLCDKFKNP